VFGPLGAAATAHPLATFAAQSVLSGGGNAVDAAIAAQAVLAVVAPHSCGVGGDAVMLVRAPDGGTRAIHGAGSLPNHPPSRISDDGSSATVPGAVRSWETVIESQGRLSLEQTLRPAVRLAREGFRLDARLEQAIARHRARLLRGGAGSWVILQAAPGELVRQPELGDLLEAIGAEGSGAFYGGEMARWISSAIGRDGGTMTAADLAGHRSLVLTPIRMGWRDQQVCLAPPPSQAVLLGMALRAADDLDPLPDELRDHAEVEVVKAVFDHRQRVSEDAGLPELHVSVSLDVVRSESQARPFLHTAGVAVADSQGWVVSSLVSLFDDFGSATFVPEGGFVLNDRGAGFTAPPNHPEPGKHPVHTLAPILLESRDGVTAVATPGGDGQIQTLLQVLRAAGDMPWEEAVARPRWRTEGSRLLIEASAPQRSRLEERGHRIEVLPDGDDRFGAVVSAGWTDGVPWAAADWRRLAWAGPA
jgi:gamma-glutamyltranspeptidase / glutathione hydrolase